MYPWGAMNNNVAVGMTGLLIIVALLACGYYIVLPFLGLARRMPLSTLTPPMAYFSAIGMGFMLIEISQMQRLMVFLGHPVYGLSVVLFTILLFSGMGSATVGADTPRPRAIVWRVDGPPDHDRGSRAANAAGHHLDAVATNRHAHSGFRPAAGASGVLHGDDVSARPQYLAPS